MLQTEKGLQAVTVLTTGTVGKLGRMAVAKEFQNRKLGRFILFAALHEALKATSHVGSFAIAVDAKTESKLGDALKWIERGIALEAQHPLGRNADCNLAGRRRALLKKLGRGQEALESAWAKFVNRPSAIAYDELTSPLRPYKAFDPIALPLGTRIIKFLRMVASL